MVQMDNIAFKNNIHKEFFLQHFPRCRHQDVYHAALIYTLGISRDTREHIDHIYNFDSGRVKTECLHESWQTSGSAQVVRMAFNLYCNGTPSVFDCDTAEEKLEECQRYTVEDLFCCGYAPYFWQAIKVRYPEYCRDLEWNKSIPIQKEPANKTLDAVKHRSSRRTSKCR